MTERCTSVREEDTTRACVGRASERAMLRDWMGNAGDNKKGVELGILGVVLDHIVGRRAVGREETSLWRKGIGVSVGQADDAHRRAREGLGCGLTHSR